MNRNIKLVTQIIVCVTRFYSQPLYHFTSFLTTAADPSLPLRMTPYRPSIIMMPYRIPSFRAGARMLCGQTGNRIVPLSEESITLMTP